MCRVRAEFFCCVGVLILVAFFRLPAFAQQEIAEGEYAIESSSGKPASRWILYKDSSGFRLRSEIQNLPSAVRVVQTEHLNGELAPTSIGYELFKGDATTPNIIGECNFESQVLLCQGRIDNNDTIRSKPYRFAGSVLLFFDTLSALDFPWLLDGALNQAVAKKDGMELITVTVSGGVADVISTTVDTARLQKTQGSNAIAVIPDTSQAEDWDFSGDKGSRFAYLGDEVITTSAGRISTKHYILQGTDEPMNVWVARGGILVRLNDVILTNYKQFVSLIPDLKVDRIDK